MVRLLQKYSRLFQFTFILKKRYNSRGDYTGETGTVFIHMLFFIV